MKKYLSVLVLFLAACGSNSNSNAPTTATIMPNQLPTAVQSAFSAEHPYAQMSMHVEQTRTDKGYVYKIPFTRTDGSTGTATYTSYGELIKDE
jgi:hypothetical protein